MVNAGGVINIADERQPGGYDRERAFAAITRIEASLADVFATAEEEGIPTSEAAEQLAQRRIYHSAAGRR